MTTAVTIKNVGCGHKVRITRSGSVVDVLSPGDETQIVYIWNGSSLTVEELPLDEEPKITS